MVVLSSVRPCQVKETKGWPPARACLTLLSAVAYSGDAGAPGLGFRPGSFGRFVR